MRNLGSNKDSKPVFQKKTGFLLEKILRKRLKSILLHL